MNGKVYIPTQAERDIGIRVRESLDESDPNLSVFMLRDLPVTKAAGLEELVWLLYRDGAVSVSDVEYLLDKLDHYMRPCKLCTENPRHYEPHSPGAPPLVDSDYCVACSRTLVYAAKQRHQLRRFIFSQITGRLEEV